MAIKFTAKDEAKPTPARKSDGAAAKPVAPEDFATATAGEADDLFPVPPKAGGKKRKPR